MKISYFRIPLVQKSFLRVWSRNFLYFRKTWLVSFFWMVLEPVIYLGAIGLGLGAYVSQMGGITYLEFFFPALLCSTSMMVAFFESTYGNYTKLTHQKTYGTIMLTQIGPSEIIAGELLWAASKSFIGVLGVVIVANFFGLTTSIHTLLALPILALLGLLFACIGMIFTSYARTYDSFIYSTSGFIVPMSLLSGTYFPLEQMPRALHYIAYLFPLTHAVQALRHVLRGEITWVTGAHIGVLLLATYLCAAVAFRRIKEKLLG